VSERISALRKLTTNPNDAEALGTVSNFQKQVCGYSLVCRSLLNVSPSISCSLVKTGHTVHKLHSLDVFY